MPRSVSSDVNGLSSLRRHTNSRSGRGEKRSRKEATTTRAFYVLKTKVEANLEVTMAELPSRLAHKRRDFRLCFKCLLQFGFRFFISVTRNSQVRPLATMNLQLLTSSQVHMKEVHVL